MGHLPSSLEVGGVDIGMLAFVALSVVTGLWRGVVFELMSLAGWFVAYFASLWFAPVVLPYVHVGSPGSALNQVLTVTSVFVLALVLWGLVARLVRAMVRSTPLSAFDRLLGAGFGSLRGALVLVVVVLIVGVTPWAQTDAWRRSRAVPWLEAAARQIRPFLPFEVHQTPSEGESYVRHRWRHLQGSGQSTDL